MSGFLLAIGLALAAAAAVWRIGRLDRGRVVLVAAALALALAGYAWQGRPALSGVSAEAVDQRRGDSYFETERSRWLPSFGAEGQWLVFSDALERDGMTQSAVTALRSGISKYPKSVALWTALGNALVLHADGLVTPAAQLAFDRAQSIDAKNPAPALFLGEAYLRSGQIDAAEQVWTDLANRAPDGARWKPEVLIRLMVIARLREMAAQQEQQQPPAR